MLGGRSLGGEETTRLKKKETPPKHRGAGGGAVCSQITPQGEKEEGGAYDCAVLLVVACLKEHECVDFQPVSQSVIKSVKV